MWIDGFAESYDNAVTVCFDRGGQRQRLASQSNAMQTAVFLSVALPALGASDVNASVVSVEGDSASPAEKLTGQWHDGSLGLSVDDIAQHDVGIASAEGGSDRGTAESAQAVVFRQKTDFTGRVVNSARDKAERQIVAIFAVTFFWTFQSVVAVIFDFKYRGGGRPSPFLNSREHHAAVA